MATVGHQDWRDLLFVHWTFSPELIAARLPDQLELDLWEGKAYVTAIPFVVEASRPTMVPRRLGMTFLEVNLRTYVRPKAGTSGDAAPGIYFFSLEASSWLAVAGARLAYGLPYFPARMRRAKEHGLFDYHSRRQVGPAAALDARWEVGAATAPAVPGTLDHFLVERYLLYVERAGRLMQARVRHEPYPLQQVNLQHVSQSLLQAAGLPSPSSSPLLHFSSGVDVAIEWLERP